MLLFPEAQARAQQEIDTAVGFNRLPNINDRSTLPHIHNLAKEVLRWQPPAPMGGYTDVPEHLTTTEDSYTPSGVPHACYKDDMYKGYRIPKGTIVCVQRLVRYGLSSCFCLHSIASETLGKFYASLYFRSLYI